MRTGMPEASASAKSLLCGALLSALREAYPGKNEAERMEYGQTG